ncbi:MAG: hypothetical protein HY943_14880 [Gammaproteobacteria bacterium]|nr:hypothetical protein [Gammaproteobacteria bacterium]
MSLVPSKKNDQVFQLSLTELAFTLVFLLLLLAGLMVHHEKRSADGERRRAEQQRQVALAEQAKLREAVRTSQELSRLRDDSEKAVAELKALLPQSAVNPDAIISDLRKCSAKDTEIRRLQAAVADLEEKLTALVAVAALVKKAGADTEVAPRSWTVFRVS